MAMVNRLLKPFRQTTGFARWILLTGLLMLLVFVVLAVFAPWIAPYGFAQVRENGAMFPKNGAPSAEHLLGTTEGFYDVWSRIVWGSRTALEVVIISVVLSVLILSLIHISEPTRPY